jgi:DNA polymerase-3 subunit delta'
MSFTADEAFVLLEQARQRDRLAQAYLVSGPPGSGGEELAAKLIASVLGIRSDPWKHHDVHVIEPQMKSRVIGVEAMRELMAALQMRSMLGGAKFAVIHDADRLNEQASNALLRTLEEPPGPTYFLLLSAQPEQILTTVLSRCVEIALRRDGPPDLTPQQAAVLEILRDTPIPAGTDGVLRIVGRFSRVLGELKAEAEASAEMAVKKEIEQLKQVGARKDAIEERENAAKALAESRYRATRTGLIQTVEQWFMDALRHQHGAPALDHESFREATATLAENCASPELLRRLTALGEMRDHLERSILEGLAVECGLLKAFGR